MTARPCDSSQHVRGALSKVASLYTKNLAHYGPTSKSVGWKDTASQQLRFSKLAELLDLSVEVPVSVNDWGCGYGAMFEFLTTLLGNRLKRYVGYDISAEMLVTAKRIQCDARARFVKAGTATEEADYTFVSGTFNVRFDVAEDAWSQYIQAQLLELGARSRRGLAFNLLSTYVDWKQEDLFYGDPGVFFEFCKRNISRYVTLLHDYPLYEWTIIVRK